MAMSKSQSDLLVQALESRAKRLSNLSLTDPDEAKRQARQTLIRAGILDKDGNMITLKDQTKAPEIAKLESFVENLGDVLEEADVVFQSMELILEGNIHLADRNKELTEQLSNLQRAYNTLVKNQYEAVCILQQNSLLSQYVEKTTKGEVKYE